jgi:hypothetical protein
MKSIRQWFNAILKSPHTSAVGIAIVCLTIHQGWHHPELLGNEGTWFKLLTGLAFLRTPDQPKEEPEAEPAIADAVSTTTIGFPTL